MQVLSETIQGMNVPAEGGTACTLQLADISGLTVEQMICCMSFHPQLLSFTNTLIKQLGFKSRAHLLQAGEEYYRNAGYQEIPIDNILVIYADNRSNSRNKKRLGKHLYQRLSNLENFISKTPNPRAINDYKQEVQSIYADGLADVQFAQKRLQRQENGFRFMVDEILLIAKANLLPTQYLLSSQDTTVEEKRRLLQKGFFTKPLIMQRLKESGLPLQEKQMLREHIWNTRKKPPHFTVKTLPEVTNMSRFSNLLKADSKNLLTEIQKILPSFDETDDTFKRVNTVAKRFQLNHSQLICGIGFNPNTCNQQDISERLGFRVHRLFDLRLKELFTSDHYSRLPIDNILAIYGLYNQPGTTERIDALLEPRLGNLESDIDRIKNPAYATSYRMELHALYRSNIIGKELAQKRMDNQSLTACRELSSEALASVEQGYFPANNLFFLNNLSVMEKDDLLRNRHISVDIVKNRLQNRRIPKEERELLEDYI